MTQDFSYMKSQPLEDFPERRDVLPGEVRFGLYQNHAYYQCEHMKDIAILSTSINGWHVQSVEPLTVTPSILNVDCGCHGFIKNGQWEWV